MIHYQDRWSVVTRQMSGSVSVRAASKPDLPDVLCLERESTLSKPFQAIT